MTMGKALKDRSLLKFGHRDISKRKPPPTTDSGECKHLLMESVSSGGITAELGAVDTK